MNNKNYVFQQWVSQILPAFMHGICRSQISHILDKPVDNAISFSTVES